MHYETEFYLSLLFWLVFLHHSGRGRRDITWVLLDKTSPVSPHGLSDTQDRRGSSFLRGGTGVPAFTMFLLTPQWGGLVTAAAEIPNYPLSPKWEGGVPRTAGWGGIPDSTCPVHRNHSVLRLTKGLCGLQSWFPTWLCEGGSLALSHLAFAGMHGVGPGVFFLWYVSKSFVLLAYPFPCPVARESRSFVCLMHPWAFSAFQLLQLKVWEKWRELTDRVPRSLGLPSSLHFSPYIFFLHVISRVVIWT